MSKQVRIVTGDAVEALEAYYPYYRCLEEGFEAGISFAASFFHTEKHLL